MKKIGTILGAAIILIGLQVIAPNKSDAAVTCSTNAWGQTVCRETGFGSSGNTWTGSTDAWGGTQWRSNTGQSFRCSTNAWGQTVCK